MLSLLKEKIIIMFKKTNITALELFRIMIPIILIVKILQELDLIKYLAYPFYPIMDLVGLPSETALALVAGIVNTNYAGVIVLISLMDSIDLTTAQVSIFGIMLLFAHGLPVELRIAQKCGVTARSQFFLRILSAVVIGIILNSFFTNYNIYQEPAKILMNVATPTSSIAAWLISQLYNLAVIYGIIFALIILMDILDETGGLKLINKILYYLFRFVGIGDKAITLTVIGMTIGVSYGGGLLIQEVKNNKELDRKDVFNSFSLMSLSHSLIEGTLIVAVIGAQFSVILWARLLFTFVVISILARVINAVSSPKFLKLFFKTKF